jgi:S-adenosylhomocysteine hydrolase
MYKPAKVGNLTDFSHAEEGKKAIAEVWNCLERYKDSVVSEHFGKLEGVRVNVVLEFNKYNACFVIGLYKMGAMIKWVSNDRHC